MPQGARLTVKVFLDIHDPRWKKHRIDFAKIVNAAAAFARVRFKIHDISERGRVPVMLDQPFTESQSEISIVLTGDSEIRGLNKKYRGIDKPTNVLSFETGDSELMGDIYISFDTAMQEADDEKRFAAHAAHLAVHGFLHLLGHDHSNDSDAEKMEAMEVKILAQLGIQNPYNEVAKTEMKENKAGLSPAKAILCALLGAAASLGFAPFYLWIATIAGIGAAYYIICAKQERSVWPSLAFGAGYAAASFWWVLNSIYVVPELAAQFAVWTAPGIIGIAVAGALIFSPPFIATNLCMRRNRASAAIRPVVFAAVWTAVLWLREWLFTGFPWNPVANIALPFPALANSMSLFGALGLTFIIIGLISSSAEIIKSKAENGKWKINPGFALFMILALGGIGYGGYNMFITLTNDTRCLKGIEPECRAEFVIRIVQPAASAAQKATHSREAAVANAEANIENLIELAGRDRKDGKKPDAVIFPETSYPYTITRDLEELDFAKRIGRTIIIGAMTAKLPEDGGGRKPEIFNSMIIAGADGRIENIYSKSHLVPFGEYRPFGDLIPTPGQLSRGDGAAKLAVGKGQSTVSFAPAICYEIIFSDSLIPKTSRDVDAIINITNDTWFGKTPGTYQHLDMARRQAIESGLPVVRANYSGISAFIGADGRVISSLPIGAAGVLDGTIIGVHMTPFRRIGRDWMMAIILAFSILYVFSLRKKY